MKKLFLFVFLFAVDSNAQLSPYTSWREIETEHFYVIYDAKQKDLAIEYALQSERVFSTLQKVFKKLPPKTVLVINDNTDDANGFATPIPRPMIQVFPVLPGPTDSIAYYKDWEYSLMIHEYAHIIQTTLAEGIWKPFRAVFGTLVAPNILAPRWLLEGMAVSIESSFDEFGRLNSPQYTSIVRAMVDEETWGTEDISRVNETSIPTWPFGQRPYFLGSMITNEIANDKGLESFDEILLTQAARVPGFVGAVPKNLFGKTYVEYLNSAYSRWEKAAKSEIKKIQGSEQKPFTVLKEEERTSAKSPQISPDEKKLIYIQRRLHKENAEVILHERNSSKDSFFDSKPKVLFERDGANTVRWIDNEQFLVDGSRTVDRHYSFSSVFKHNLKTKKTKRITNSDPILNRLQYPLPISKNSFVSVQNFGGGTRLVKVRHGKRLKVLYAPKLGVRISQPALVGNSTLVFNERTLEGDERLLQYNLKTKKVSLISGLPADSRSPVSTNDGFIFISEKTGVGNLYNFDLKTGKVTPVTNSIATINDGVFDQNRNELIVTRMTANGVQLEVQKDGLQPLNPPDVQREDYVQKSFSQAEKPNLKLTEKNYWGSSYLFPQYWLPTFNITGSGNSEDEVGYFVGLSVASQDPVGHHTYALDIGYDTLTETPQGSFVYQNAQLPVYTTIGFSNTSYYLFGDETELKVNTGVLAFDFYLWKLSNNYRGRIFGGFINSEIEDEFSSQNQTYGAGISYSDFTQLGFQISPEKGGRVYLDYTQYVGDDENENFGKTTFGGSTFISWLLPKHHVIYLRADHTGSPKDRSIYENTTVAGGEFSGFSSGAPHVIRGYPVGEFLGWTVSSANFEYRFPLFRTYKGARTGPLFAKSWHAAVTADIMTMEGAYYKFDEDAAEDEESTRELVYVSPSKTFSSAGAEVRLDATLLYNIPATIRVGMYYGFEEEAYGGFYPFIGLGSLF